MHFEDPAARPAAAVAAPWWSEMTRYHWFVLLVASLGWLFDTMDQQLFNLARKPAITELLQKAGSGVAPSAARVAEYGGYATMIFMLGWAVGGLIFGILGDRIGRAKTMMLTILLYSLFTGLSALSVGVWDFAFYRFLTGLGVGGEFAVGVALVAEVMPERARVAALGWVQALSAVGNMIGAVVAMVLGRLEETGAVGSAWRGMFLVGMAPALLAVLIRRRLKEPDRWKAAVRAEDELPGDEPRLGSVSELFGDPRWRKNAIVGMLLAFSGVVGLWGIGFFSFDLIRSILDKSFRAQGLVGKELAGRLTLWTGIASLLQNFGAFWGMYFFSKITGVIGRKPAFFISFLLAMFATAFTFWFISELWHIVVLIPILGFCQLTLFGGYAIYFPELFPTRLRSTGTSFCYNVGRLVAAVGPLFLGLLTSRVYASYGADDPSMPQRLASLTMCSVFLVGLCALPFAPETRGKPLPE